MIDKEGDFDELSWEINVPIFKNRLILKQIFIAIGIPFGILVIVLFSIKAYEGLLLIAITFLLTYFFVKLLFKGTYDVRYTLNKKGVLCETQSKQKKRVEAISKITFFLGLITKNPSVAGAGLLSGSNTRMEISWKKVRKVKINEKQKNFLIYGVFTENIVLFCTEENFKNIQKYLNNLDLNK